MIRKSPIRIDMLREQCRESMKSFHWRNWLQSHSLFSSLNEQEIADLLRDEVSQEREYPQDSVILREGEGGDSLFLIGTGSVQVTLGGTEGPLRPVAILQAGEIVGEMAVLERKPRSATVVAREKCLLLEVAGEEVRKLLETHPAMQVKIYTVVRDRLRQWFQSLGSVEPHR
jgi:CRP-like cAMP-binding protein